MEIFTSGTIPGPLNPTRRDDFGVNFSYRGAVISITNLLGSFGQVEVFWTSESPFEGGFSAGHEVAGIRNAMRLIDLAYDEAERRLMRAQAEGASYSELKVTMEKWA